MHPRNIYFLYAHANLVRLRVEEDYEETRCMKEPCHGILGYPFFGKTLYIPLDSLSVKLPLFRKMCIDRAARVSFLRAHVVWGNSAANRKPNIKSEALARDCISSFVSASRPWFNRTERANKSWQGRSPEPVARD